MGELWAMLDSAQNSPNGIPEQLVCLHKDFFTLLSQTLSGLNEDGRDPGQVCRGRAHGRAAAQVGGSDGQGGGEGGQWGEEQVEVSQTLRKKTKYKLFKEWREETP